MAISRGPKIVTNGLVLALDASDNNSFAAIDLPIKYGLVMWMDAADDSTFSYSSGTTVSQWRDKSGFNYHMGPKVNGPTRSVVLNSRKVLAFTAAQTIGNNTINLSTSANTVFVVSRLTGTTNGRVLTCNLDSSGNNWILGHHGGTYNDYFAEGWVSDGGSFDTNWRMYMGDWSGTSTDLANLYSNGTAITTNSTAASQGPKYLGVNYYSNEVSTCEVAEIVVFDRVLSVTERKQVHTYLGQKWGVSNTDRSIVDISGNNNAGSFGGAAGSQNVANMPDYDFYNKGSFKFNGTSDFIQYPSLLNLGNVFTINFWIKPTSNTRQTIISNGYPYLANKGFFLVCPGNSSTDIFLSLGNDQKQVQSNTGAITTGVVQMVTAVANGVGGLMKLYVNGIEVSYAVQQNADISLQYDSGIFVTGKRDTNSADYLSSNLYALGIYNRALTATEVLQNYNAQKPKYTNTIVQQGLVLNLDAGNSYSYGGAGTIFYDVSGNGKIGTLTGGVTYSSLYGGDFILDGVNGYIQTDLNQNTDNAQITWEAWFWDNSPGGFAGNTAIISNYGAVATTPFTILHIYDNGNVFFGQRNSSGTADDVVYGSSICDSVWHHLVGVVDGSNMHIYVDGIVRASKTKITGTTTSGQNLVIGGNHLGRYQSCRIASARCYNIALSAAQVLQNYNATKSRFGL
jgi:hypothetical protein